MELCGTYRLISSARQILDTGEEVGAFGKNAKGLVMYGEDGHFLVLVTNDGRPKPASIETMTDQQRSDLHRTMSAYGRTYAFDGKKVEHHVDLAWNEVWAGTTVVRDVKAAGDRLIYTSRPAPFGGDGKMSVITVVWEKVK
jgi:hypothetical protein